MSLSVAGDGFTAPQPSRADAAKHVRRGFGWIRDRPDPRDFALTAPSFASPAPRPPTADLTVKFPPPYDQKGLGSCTANAIAAAVQFARRAHSKPDDFVPSRLFIYYQERKMEQTLYIDAGAQIRDGIMSVANIGVCSEDKWPYDGIAGDPTTHVFPQNARAIQEPPAALQKEAQQFKTISYAPLKQDAAVLETCVASGYPFLFGFTVYDHFTEGTTLLKKPGPADHITPYGHAVLAVGYNSAKKTFRIRNSWGPNSNSGGYFDMDYDYVLNPGLASDFWVVYQTLGFQ
jgi:C1A family cysteine protease